MKGKHAFTFIEVLLSLLILVSAATILSGLQFKSLMRIWQGTEKIDRIFWLKKEFNNFYMRALRKDKNLIKFKDKPQKIDYEKPEMQIETQFLNIQKKSELKEFLDDIDILQIESEWKNENKKLKLKLVGFVAKYGEKHD